ncbi:MAG: hypothetical protein AB7H66_03260 [Hyphomonadaceae bacterium]
MTQHPLECRRRFGSHKLSVMNWLCLTGEALNEAACELHEQLKGSELSSEERERIVNELDEIERAVSTVLKIDLDLDLLVREHEERLRA